MLGCKGLSLRNSIMEIRFVQMVNAPEDLFSMVDGAITLPEAHLIALNFQLPWVTKTEFILTISMQYPADKWWELEKSFNKGIISWSYTKLSKITSWELCGRQQGELWMRSKE